MRLQLIALCLAVLWPASAGADERAGSWLSVYTDDDGLTVVSPQISGRYDGTERLEVEISYDADVISAASVDVTTAASPRGYTETRHGMILGTSWNPGEGTRYGVRYLPSWEPDYRSHGVAANAGREWVDRRMATRLDLRVNTDSVGRSGDERNRWQSLTTVAAGASVGWIISQWTVAQLAYELQHARGYQASPYRYAEVVWPDGTRLMVPEATPDRRVRQAAAVSIRHAITKRWFGATGYRLYRDSWGVLGHAADWELQHALRDDLAVFGVEGRIYRQSAADFYRPRYQAELGMVPAVRVADKQLAESWSVLIGARAEVRLASPAAIGQVRAIGKLELYDQHYRELPRLVERRALVLSVGIALER